MDQHLRRWLARRYGVSTRGAIGENVVEKWIGFGADEEHRVSRASAKYQCFRFPLIELGLDKAAVVQWLHDRKLPIPPRSVCVGCWANGVDTLREIRDKDPTGWAKARAFDGAIRDLSGIGVTNPCYVSRTLRPLAEALAEADRDAEWYEANSCDSGHCFL